MFDIQILEQVGEGGHSKVFKAIDNGSGKLVAVKILENLVDGLSKSLWLKETEALSRLASKNIVKLVSSRVAKTNESEQYWIVLEWLQETLSERFGRGAYKFQPDTWSKYAGGLVRGITHAHERNLAHRDIKPDNLLFRTDQVKDTNIVIADFGISKIVSSATSTNTTASFGSEIYSPGDGMNRDAFSRDVFSVAAVLAQLTTDVLFTDVADIYQALDRSALPNEVNGFLRSCLDPNPDKRPKNMIEFKSRIFEIFDSLPNSSRDANQNLISVPVYFTIASADQFLPGANADFERAKAQFNNLARNSVMSSGQIMKPKPEHDDGTTQISLRISNWVFHCKVEKSNESLRLIVLKALQPTDEELERYSFGSSPLGKIFKFKAYLPKEKPLSAHGVDALEAHLRKSYIEEDEVINVPGTFESWSRVLDAREEFARGILKPMKFSKSKQSSGMVVFTLEGSIESYLEDSCWDVKGLRNVFFEVETFDGTDLWTRPSKDLASIPENGELSPSLGRDAVSLRRQRKAVEDFRNGQAVSGLLGQTIENPELSPVSNEQPRKIETVIENLDHDKEHAVGMALATEDVFVVQGPPGTGKTNFIAEYIHQIRADNPEAKILLVAQTHVAVDNALLRLEANGISNMVRIGDPKDSRISKFVKKYLVEIKIGDWVDKIRNQSEESLARRAGIAPSELNKLRALSLLFEISSARKQLAYLRSRLSQGTSALEESLSPEEPSKMSESIHRTEGLLEALRRKLQLVASGVAVAERSKSDQECMQLLDTFAASFPDSEKLVSMLRIQTDWLLKIHTDSDLRSKYLNKAAVVAGTCIGFLREFTIHDFVFDYCIVDEASKATATESLVPMAMARHVVLVGDDKQLPPNDEELLESTEILANHGLTQADVSTTLFTSLKDRLPASKSTSLRTQWRMTRAIGDLISNCFYDGELISPSTTTISGYENLFGKPVTWLDTSPHPRRFETQVFGGGYSNWVEAKQIAIQLVKLAKRIKSRHLHVDGREPSILIVSPYRAQRRSILEQIRLQDQDLLSSIEWRIETADAVQGTEADIVIVATTRSNSTKRLGFLGMAHWKRINVALSRARFGLIIIGDTQFMQDTNGPLAKVLDYIRKNSTDCEVLEVEL